MSDTELVIFVSIEPILATQIHLGIVCTTDIEKRGSKQPLFDCRFVMLGDEIVMTSQFQIRFHMSTPVYPICIDLQILFGTEKVID